MLTGFTDSETKWIRTIWMSYWGIVALHAAAQLFSYWFLPYEAAPAEFYYFVLLKPTLVMSAAIGAGWLASRASAPATFYALIASGTVLAVMLIRLNTDIRIISALLLLPILVSVLFFRVRLTLFAAALQLGAFGLVYMRDGSYRSYLTAFDVIAVPCFIGMCALLAVIIMVRGRELRKELYEAMSAKQALMVQYADMRRRAQTDSLTGLYNQASFREHFRLAVEYGAGGTAAAFQLALADIDDFKAINDTFGHRAGDAVLALVARTIQEKLPAGAIAARYGGEEFALLLFEPSAGDALRTCEAIRSAVEGTRHEALEGRKVTVSMGVAVQETGMGEDGLFELADARLYEAKRLGKNRTVGPPA